MVVLALFCAVPLLGGCNGQPQPTVAQSLFNPKPFPIEEANRVAADPKATQADVADLWEQSKASYKSCTANLDDLQTIFNPNHKIKGK